MKNMSKKQKIVLGLIALIILVGIIIMCTIGFKFDLKYEKAKSIEINLQKEFEISDIKQITNEVMPGQEVLIQKVEVYEDAINITSQDITEEQKTQLITKINEKYGTTIESENITINTKPHTRGRDIIKPYIVPLTITTIIILAYIAIRGHKINSGKAVLRSINTIILAQTILFSVIAIARIPIGRLTVPMVIIVYLLTLLEITTGIEKELLNKVEKETK